MTGYEPPGRLSRRRLLIGAAVGAADALLVACGGAPNPPTAPPPATPVPSAGTAIPSSPTITATRVAATRSSPALSLPTATPSIPRTTVPGATATPSTLAFWTDPRGLIQLRYPSTWLASAVDPSRRPHNILQLAAPDAYGGVPVLWLDLYDPQRGALGDEVKLARDGWAGKPYRLSEQAIEDLTVGGEAAKAFTFTYTPTFNPTIRSRGEDVVCNHAGREVVVEAITDFENGQVAAAREIEAIIASIRFLP